MGFFSSLFSPVDDVPNEPTTVVTDDDALFCQAVQIYWQYELAKTVVCNIATSLFENTEWQTYRNNDQVKGDEYFRLNYALNNKETAKETFRKLTKQLVYNNKALMFETAKKEFFVADSFSFKDKELFMKPNTFTDIRIGDETLIRTFKENQSALLFHMRHMDDNVFELMNADYANISALMEKGAKKAMGTKYALNTKAQGSNKTDPQFIKKLQEAYLPLMEKDNAVFITYNGETLQDLTEKQRGSEVQQVLKLGENTNAINDEILKNVGRAYGIPVNFMKGEFTEDSTDVFSMMMTHFGKPLLNNFANKMTLYLMDRESILNGSRIVANLDKIRFHESLKSATAIDKLIGSGVFTINELRDKLSEDPVEDGNVRFITKNYGVLSEYVKGEDNGI